MFFTVIPGVANQRIFPSVMLFQVKFKILVLSWNYMFFNPIS